jgi:hypothetical protein
MHAPLCSSLLSSSQHCCSVWICSRMGWNRGITPERCLPMGAAALLAEADRCMQGRQGVVGMPGDCDSVLGFCAGSVGSCGSFGIDMDDLQREIDNALPEPRCACPNALLCLFSRGQWTQERLNRRLIRGWRTDSVCHLSAESTPGRSSFRRTRPGPRPARSPPGSPPASSHRRCLFLAAWGRPPRGSRRSGRKRRRSPTRRIGRHQRSRRI